MEIELTNPGLCFWASLECFNLGTEVSKLVGDFQHALGFSQSAGLSILLSLGFGFFRRLALFFLTHNPAFPQPFPRAPDSAERATSDTASDTGFKNAVELRCAPCLLRVPYEPLSSDADGFLRTFGGSFKPKVFDRALADKLRHSERSLLGFGNFLDNLGFKLRGRRTEHPQEFSRQHRIQRARKCTTDNRRSRRKFSGVLVDILKDFPGIHPHRRSTCADDSPSACG